MLNDLKTVKKSQKKKVNLDCLKLPCDNDGRGRANNSHHCVTSRNGLEEAYFLPLLNKQPFFVSSRNACVA